MEAQGGPAETRALVECGPRGPRAGNPVPDRRGQDRGKRPAPLAGLGGLGSGAGSRAGFPGGRGLVPPKSPVPDILSPLPEAQLVFVTPSTLGLGEGGFSEPATRDSPLPPPARDRKGEKNSKKSFITLLYITFHLSTDTK